MNTYYVVFEVVNPRYVTKSWKIVETEYNLDNPVDLEDYIRDLVDEYDNDNVWVINWKPMTARD